MMTQSYDKRAIPVEHVTIRANKSFDLVKGKLEERLPRIDDAIFAHLRNGESERALRLLKASPPLSIFGFRDHGALLIVAGLNAYSTRW